jgi:hypothetical protein
MEQTQHSNIRSNVIRSVHELISLKNLVHVIAISVSLGEPVKGPLSLMLIVDGEEPLKQSFRSKTTKLQWDLKPFLCTSLELVLCVSLTKSTVTALFELEMMLPSGSANADLLVSVKQYSYQYLYRSIWCNNYCTPLLGCIKI